LKLITQDAVWPSLALGLHPGKASQQARNIEFNQNIKEWQHEEIRITLEGKGFRI